MSVFSSLQPGLSHNKKEDGGRNANFLPFHHQSELISPPLVLTKSPSSSSSERRVIPYSCMRSFGRGEGDLLCLSVREPLSQFLPPSPRGPSLPCFATKGEEVRRSSGGQFLQDKKGKTTKRNPATHSPIPKRGLLLLLLRFFSEILQSYDIISGKIVVEFQASFPRLRDTGNSVHIHTETTENVRGTKRR